MLIKICDKSSQITRYFPKLAENSSFHCHCNYIDTLHFLKQKKQKKQVYRGSRLRQNPPYDHNVKPSVVFQILQHTLKQNLHGSSASRHALQIRSGVSNTGRLSLNWSREMSRPSDKLSV